MKKNLVFALSFFAAVVLAGASQFSAKAAGATCEPAQQICYRFMGPDGSTTNIPGVLTYKHETLD